MPIPNTKSVRTLRAFFRKEHPEWSAAQVTAVTLKEARKHGASIPPPPKKRNNRGK